MSRAPVITPTNPHLREVVNKLRNYEQAHENFVWLCEKGAKPEDLIRRLHGLIYGHKVKLPRLSKRQAGSLSTRIKKTADLIEHLNREQAVSVMDEHWREALDLPKKLRAYAAGVSDLPRRVASRWNPIQTSALSQVIWYVKQTTHKYHDEQVSALIGAVLEKVYTADALKTWRSNHTEDIRAFGDLDILPWLPRPLPSK